MEFSKTVKKEALRRLSELSEVFGLDEKIAEYFKEGRVCYSHSGQIDMISEDKKFAEVVRMFEEVYEACVYHAVLTSTDYFGTLLTFLFVSKKKKEWETECLEGNQIFSFVVGVDADLYDIITCCTVNGEFGTVMLTDGDNGTLRRIG